MSTKKKALIIVSVVLAVLIAACGIVTYSFLPHPLNYPIKDIEPAGATTVDLVSK